MTYFSEIDQDGTVKRTVSVADSVKDGAKLIASQLGGLWVESTKTDGKLRAGIGYKYLPYQQGFQAPQPFASWSFNEDQWQWEPPVAMPADDKPYVWNEDKGSWEELA
jgi:hypothetical protein